MSAGSYYDQAEQADNVLPLPRPVEPSDVPTVDDLVSAVERAEYHERLQQLRAERAALRDQHEEHGYGDTTDCKCGRNFDKVRGLREHLTKQRRIAAEREARNQQVEGRS